MVGALVPSEQVSASRKAHFLNVVTKIVSGPWIPGRVLGIPSHGPQPSPWKLPCCLHGYHGLVTWAGQSGTCVMGQKGSRTLDVSGYHGCSSRMQDPDFIHCFPISRPTTGRCTNRTRCLRKTLPPSQSENPLLDSQRDPTREVWVSVVPTLHMGHCKKSVAGACWK